MGYGADGEILIHLPMEWGGGKVESDGGSGPGAESLLAWLRPRPR